MTDNLRASIMCNQVLRVVKESKLNYLVNETPYSAFVTIRKKIVKHIEAEDTHAVDDLALSDVVLRQENISLRQKLCSLESEKGLLREEIETLEQKVEELTMKNNSQDEKVDQLEAAKNSALIRLEVTKGQLSNQTDNLAKQVEEEKANDKKLKETKTKLSKLENISKERDENFVIMEFTLKNRDIEIERLNDELRELKVKETSKYACDECEFSVQIESDLRSHIETFHKHLCPHCNYTFAGENKLKKHMCRIKVEYSRDCGWPRRP